MQGKIYFGVYELDCDALELRKHGVPIRLQDQPLRVLTILTRHPGEIVTREELQDQIWGKDTFVDFDQSLNKAVNRIREVLNDDAATPRYIETVPRRGYRFVAPVTRDASTEPHTAPLGAEKLPRHSIRSIRSAKIAVFAIAGLAVVLGAVVLWWRKPQQPMLPRTRRVTSSASWLGGPSLSRDGKLLAYVRGVEGEMPHIWLQQTAGGEAIPVTKGAEGDYAPDFSPDGTHIAFWSYGKSFKRGGAVYLAPTFGGEPKLLAKTSGGRPQFSPDGESIALKDVLRGAITISVESGEETVLALNENYSAYGDIFWSPDGDRVLFYGATKREPQRPEGWWTAPFEAREATPVLLTSLQEGEGPGRVLAWVRDENGREWIVYSVSKGVMWNVLRVRVSPQGQVLGKPEPVTSGTGWLNWGPSPWANGKLVYTTENGNDSIYEIPITSQGRKSAPTFQLPLAEGGDYHSAWLSHDGRWMAYFVSKGDGSFVMLRDLAKGTDHRLEEDGDSNSISPDGSKIVFSRPCESGKFHWGEALPCAFLISAVGGEPEPLCEDCTGRGFSPDGSVVLIQKYNRTGELHHKIAAIDLATKAEKDFLDLPGKSLYHAIFSWDGHWVVFKEALGMGNAQQLLIAPVRNGVAGQRPEWIEVTDGRYSDDKPQFSPDGNTVYFTSTRDGYLCIWAQKLNPATKRPVGAPYGFEHFHNSIGAHAASSNVQDRCDLSVARDKMLINLPNGHTDMWITQLE
jgi:Tol biopolymer transport system component/DNA-binding winged helix-turn-helix (wHTH) protein